MARITAMRADAQRNRDRLLDAAVELVLEVGAEPPLDAIARRAGVGIGTLYRHFPDREQLLAAVAEHALEAAVDAAQMALAHDGDALRTYLHAAVDRGVGVLNLVHPMLEGPDWSEQRERVAPLLESMLEHGVSSGRLREDVGVMDVVAAVVRFSRPLAMGLDRLDERALAHRHLDIYLDGLAAAGPDVQALPEAEAPDRWTT